MWQKKTGGCFISIPDLCPLSYLSRGLLDIAIAVGHVVSEKQFTSFPLLSVRKLMIPLSMPNLVPSDMIDRTYEGAFKYC